MSRPAIRNAATSPTIGERAAELAGQVLGVGQRAGHAVGQVLAAWWSRLPGRPPRSRSADAGHRVGARRPARRACSRAPCGPDIAWSWDELHVHVRGLSAERRRGEADDLEALVVERRPCRRSRGPCGRRSSRSRITSRASPGRSSRPSSPGRRVTAPRSLLRGVHAAHAARRRSRCSRAGPRRAAAGPAPKACGWPVCSGTVPGDGHER